MLERAYSLMIVDACLHRLRMLWLMSRVGPGRPTRTRPIWVTWSNLKQVSPATSDVAGARMVTSRHTASKRAQLCHRPPPRKNHVLDNNTRTTDTDPNFQANHTACYLLLSAFIYCVRSSYLVLPAASQVSAGLYCMVSSLPSDFRNFHSVKEFCEWSTISYTTWMVVSFGAVEGETFFEICQGCSSSEASPSCVGCGSVVPSAAQVGLEMARVSILKPQQSVRPILVLHFHCEAFFLGVAYIILHGRPCGSEKDRVS